MIGMEQYVDDAFGIDAERANSSATSRFAKRAWEIEQQHPSMPVAMRVSTRREIEQWSRDAFDLQDAMWSKVFSEWFRA